MEKILKTKKEKEIGKERNAEYEIQQKERREREWGNISSMKIIPATEENIRVVLEHLNDINWGLWDLPSMSIGYIANQYDYEGNIVTTICLDEGIGKDNERLFKVGNSQRGYLERYRRL